MPARAAAALLFASLSVMTGCLSDDPPELGEASSEAEVEITPPQMSAYCDRCLDGHVVGDPVTIQTSFYGECRGTLPSTYPCHPQPYTLHIECLDAACDIAPARGGGDLRQYTAVTPLDPGPLTIRVTMNDRVFDLRAFTSHVPVELRVTCLKGSGYDQPCVDGVADERVMLALTLWDDGRRLYPTERFDVSSDRPGLAGTGAWYLSDLGVHHVTASYGPVTQDATVTVIRGEAPTDAPTTPTDGDFLP